MKRLLIRIRNSPIINRVVRQALKYVANKSFNITKKLKLYWPISGTVIIEKPQFTIKLVSEGNDGLTNRLYYENAWEDEIIELMKALMPKTMFFFDIGGNIGMFSLLAEYFNPIAKIYCFEPNPINVTRIKSNLEINQSRQIDIIPKAVGEKQGQLDFYVPKGKYTSDVSSFFKTHTKNFNDFGTECINVDVISLDDFVKEEYIVPDLIKIDIELYEYQALKGALNLLKQASPIIIIELFNDIVKRTTNPDLDKELEKDLTIKTEQLLIDLGYYFYIISKQGILSVQNLQSNPDSSMYLLSKSLLNKAFYPIKDFPSLSQELFN